MLAPRAALRQRQRSSTVSGRSDLPGEERPGRVLYAFLRLDGYYVLSDLVGVPDLFRRVGPVLRSSLPFREPEPSVAQLKPWVRRVVAGWVFLLVPVLAINLGYFLLAAPRIFATGWDSAGRLIGVMTGSPAVERRLGGGAAGVAAAAGRRRHLHVPADRPARHQERLGLVGRFGAAAGRGGRRGAGSGDRAGRAVVPGRADDPLPAR